MRKGWVLGAILLTGCHVETDAPPVKTSPPATPPAVTSETTKPVPAPAKALKHPDRIYQLADLETAKVEANGTEFDVWVMNEEGERMEGMMFLKPGDVQDRQGMIFVFQSVQDADSGFWMQNTFIPLDIIYIGTDRRVVSIGKGEALNEKSVKAEGPYQYVLELKQGMAAKLGIKKGTQVNLPATLVAEG